MLFGRRDHLLEVPRAAEPLPEEAGREDGPLPQAPILHARVRPPHSHLAEEGRRCPQLSSTSRCSTPRIIRQSVTPGMPGTIVDSFWLRMLGPAAKLLH